MIYKKKEKNRVGKIKKTYPTEPTERTRLTSEWWGMMGKIQNLKSLDNGELEFLKYAFTLHIFSPLLLEGNWRKEPPPPQYSQYISPWIV